MSEHAMPPADSLRRLVGLRSFNDVMRAGIHLGCNADEVIDEIRRRFGRIRCGVANLRMSYIAMSQANSSIERT